MIVKFDHLPVVAVDNAGASVPPRSSAGSSMDSGIDLNEDMQFDDVLNSQDGTQLVFDEILRNPTVVEGGKIIQPGGKILPGLSESELPVEPLGPVAIVPDTPVSVLGAANEPAIDSEHSKRMASQFVVTGHFSELEPVAGTAGALFDFGQIGEIGKISTSIPVSAGSKVRIGRPMGIEDSFKNKGLVSRPIIANNGGQDATLPLVGSAIGKDGVLAQQVLDVIDDGIMSVEKSERFGVGEQTVPRALAQNQSQTLANGVQLSPNEPNIQPTTKSVADSPIAIPLKDSGWRGEFLGRMSLMVKGGLQEASIQLNPPELGRMEVKLSTDGDQVKILFTVQHAAAREAIEQAMPRLREMLEQGGLQLAQSDVADQSQSQQRENRLEDSSSAQFSNGQEEGLAELVPEVSIVRPDSIVDYYI